MNVINQYSYLISALCIVALAGLLLYRKGHIRRAWAAALAVLILLGGAWGLIRPVQTVSAGADQVNQLIGAGKPVLLELQSPYCLACIRIKPYVDSLETEMGDRLHIVRVNVQEDPGRSLAAQYRLAFTPTFIFFDAAGKEQWRSVGTLKLEMVRQSVAAP